MTVRLIAKSILGAIFFLSLFSFSVKKPKKFLPPGTVPINETFFADETEISNFSWQEYELWIKLKYGSLSAEHISTLPDTNVWHDRMAYNDPYVQYYYRHPAYKNYPVVGISHQQAQAFCKWRTDRVQEFWFIRHKTTLNIEYRLPTKEEWEMLAVTGPYIMKNNGRDEKNRVRFNFCRPDDTLSVAGYMNDNADVTAPVFSYWKNWYGLFNIYGNVAEMIAEKGICKGGSWRHRFEECRAGKDTPYAKPTAWLGFRCVCIKKDS